MGRLFALQYGAGRRTDSGREEDDAVAEANVGKQDGGHGGSEGTAGRQGFGRGGTGFVVAGGGMASVWAIDGLLEPIAVRFRFHFEEDRPTNRADREWWEWTIASARETELICMMVCVIAVQA